jgi:hypothetical protein
LLGPLLFFKPQNKIERARNKRIALLSALEAISEEHQRA